MRRKVVKDIPSALAVAEGLVDYNAFPLKTLMGMGKREMVPKKARPRLRRMVNRRMTKRKIMGMANRKGKVRDAIFLMVLTLLKIVLKKRN